DRDEKEMVDVLMLLATFAVTITYVAGLSPPGGFWTSTQDGHRLSDPVLQARNRYRVFFICNTTSFAMSLLIIVLLLEKKLLGKKKLRLLALCGLIVVALLGLMGAYAAGSCREASKTVLVLAVPVGVCLLLALVFSWGSLADQLDSVLTRFRELVKVPSGTCTGTNVDLHEQNTRDLVMLLATLVVTITYQAGLDPPGGLWLDDGDGHNIGHPVLQTTHPTRYRVFFYSNSAAFVTSLVVIMMLQSKFLLNRHTLEATLVLDLFGLITAYGAGSTREVTQSIYIVALAGIVLVYVIVHITIRDHDPEPVGDHAVKHLDDKRKVLLLVAILAATLTYQAGLTPPGGFWLADDRELGRRAGFPILLDNYTRRYNTFFYCNAASFMASVTLILLLVNPKLYRPGIRCRALYVCMLVGMFGLMGAYAAGSSRNLKTSVYVLILVGAVLAFIASLLAIFLLVPYLKSQGCRVFCFVPFGQSQKGTEMQVEAGHSSSKSHEGTDEQLEAGHSSRKSHEGTDEQLEAGHSSRKSHEGTDEQLEAGHSSNKSHEVTDGKVEAAHSSGDKNSSEKKEKLQYLMLLGILAASMTYQTGLKPPGGLWQDNNDGHYAGNPILRDINKDRYNAFFYSNSASFMASIVVVVMLLPLTLFPEKYTTKSSKKDTKSTGEDTKSLDKITKPAKKDPKLTEKDKESPKKDTWPLWPMHTAILLDMMGLLVAYAAGSTRKWETSRNIMVLIVPLLAYIGLYAALSVFRHREEPTVPQPAVQPLNHCKTCRRNCGCVNL
uniref:PGG domain-containing protein n=3 Tax=Aegilops tauschii subsp. strangulata TaxID=200361 RepID=A0A453QER9_AEGTS